MPMHCSRSSEMKSEALIKPKLPGSRRTMTLMKKTGPEWKWARDGVNNNNEPSAVKTAQEEKLGGSETQHTTSSTCVWQTGSLALASKRLCCDSFTGNLKPKDIDMFSETIKSSRQRTGDRRTWSRAAKSGQKKEKNLFIINHLTEWQQ